MEPNENPYNHPGRKALRRELRTSGTSAEASLWSMLKNRQVDGARFRRQYSVGPYVLDFYCASARLCVELDGAEHFAPEGQFNDGRRDEYLLAEHDIRTLRFENGMVFTQPENVIAAIRQALAERLGAHASSSLRGRGRGERQSHTPSPLRGTPPTLGGELAPHGNLVSDLEGETHEYGAQRCKFPLRNSSPKVGEVDAERTEGYYTPPASPGNAPTPPSPLGAEAKE